LRRKFQYLAAAELVYCALLSLLRLNIDLANAPPREQDEVSVMEGRYLPIHFYLKELNYRKDMAHATTRSLRGEPLSESDHVHYAQLRYVTIPVNLIAYPSDSPWILGDFTAGEPVAPPPPGYVKAFDPGTGLVLYRRELQQ
jgi:hypothetical protein